MHKPECTFDYNELQVHISDETGTDRQALETQLLDASLPLPLSHRASWVLAQKPLKSWFLSVRDTNGKCLCGLAVEVSSSRALPGYRLLRVERFGSALTDQARRAALYGLARYARQHRDVLRVNLEVFSRKAAVRDLVAQDAKALGYRQSQPRRSYMNTLIIDLTPDESSIFASFHPTARRHIRAVDRKPVELRAITDQNYAARMTCLLKATMARTDGSHEPFDWNARIEFSTRYPHLSRLVGVFVAKRTGPDALLAFAWGRWHGDHADYAVAASTRAANIKIPLGYAPAWDLMLWAKNNGASWFDFGGITPCTTGDNDPLHGISEFKRYFSRHEVTVGEEWVFEPRPLQAKTANAISSGAAWVRRVAWRC